MPNRSQIDQSRSRFSLAHLVRRRIVEGHYPAGGRLPNRLVLSKELDASSNTIQAALDQLVAEGFLESRPRIGTFVVARPPHTHVYGLSVVESKTGKRLFSDARFVTLLVDLAQKMALPDGKSIRIYEGIDGKTFDERLLELRADIYNRRVAGIIASHPYCTPEMVPDSPVPWVIAGEEIPAGTHALTFPMHQWVLRAAERLHATGRKRVACLFNASHPVHLADRTADLLRSQGFDVQRRLLQAVLPTAREWARRAVELMLSANPRPDALLICDDILVDDALGGVIDAGLLASDDFQIISLANFPSPAPVHFPVTRLGVDLRQFLLTAIDLIDRRNAGLEVPAAMHLPALFESELAPAATSLLPQLELAASK